MKASIHHRTTCRLCGGGSLKEFIRFPAMPFTDEFVSEARRGQEFRADIPVFWCVDCHSAQTLHDVEVTEYYRDYRYTVSSSPFARRFMQRLAEALFQRYGLRSGDRVIEVGSGDGHQLSCFKNLGARVLGFEPSAELTRAAEAVGVPTVQTLFGGASASQIPADLRPAQVVLLTYTFDHLPEPRPFLDLVQTVLDPRRGLLVIEVHDLARIVERREICLFEHEHSIYLTALTMQRLLERCGFRLLSTDLLPPSERRGNSLLIVAAPAATTVYPASFVPDSADLALEEWRRLSGFGQEVRDGIARLRAHLEAQRAAGRKVAGYGAGGRGVMTLAMSGLGCDEVRYLCDQNASFHGLFTPATHLPVVPPEHVDREPVDELVVFSYAYLEEIRQRLSNFARRGGRFTSILDLI
ncbi:MAG: methyltransferase domain-containing protein [Verrucomicrobiales bacterium]|nr:methyltransferase domain-containing protein [Verrucomicrobiales bacterium]